DRQLVPFPDQAPEGQVLPIEADRPSHGACRAVDDARRPDPDPDEALAVRADELIDQAVRERDRLIAVPPVKWQAGRPTDFSAEIDDRAAEFVLAKVDADQVPRIVCDTQQNGRLAPVRRPS